MQLKQQCRSFLSLPPLLPFLSVSFLSFYAPLSLASAHTRHATHTHTASRVCAAVGECVGPVIHFTPHWSETCDCGSGLCLFLTPWESTGVRGHMQEKHTHIYSCTCTRTNTTVTSSYFFSFSFFFFLNKTRLRRLLKYLSSKNCINTTLEVTSKMRIFQKDSQAFLWICSIMQTLLNHGHCISIIDSIRN